MKEWPDYDDNGDLPVGIHQATLAEVVEHFGQSNFQRQRVAQRLARIYDLALSTGQVARFIIYGSFVTAKPFPNDVDVFMLMEDAFDLYRLSDEMAVIFDHMACQNYEGASVFWVRKMAVIGGEQAAIEFWQTKRDDTNRGIVEVTSRD
jgi:hypothetical protein